MSKDYGRIPLILSQRLQHLLNISRGAFADEIVANVSGGFASLAALVFGVRGQFDYSFRIAVGAKNDYLIR